MLQPIYAAMDPGVMSRGVGAGSCFTTADIDGILEAAARYDVLAIGPGVGPVEGDFVESLVARWDGPVVLDADGLNALSDLRALTRDGDIVVTPHGGEFFRLTGNEPSPAAAGVLARDCDVVVLLKGNPTFVLDGSENWVVASGGSELATIGTGDVLTGMTAAFLAGGLPADIAARSAAFHHGAAGRRLASVETVTATGLAAEIGRYLAALDAENVLIRDEWS
jgi:NAD(P)H-hydrate epimerase